MLLQPVTVNVPESLYHQLQRLAAQSNRSVEDELVNVLATAVPGTANLPAELTEAIAPLTLLDDAALWQAARSRLAGADAERLEELHLKRQRAGLTDQESQELALLVRHYERALLVRAQAAALLRQRGHDVSGLLTPS